MFLYKTRFLSRVCCSYHTERKHHMDRIRIMISSLHYITRSRSFADLFLLRRHVLHSTPWSICIVIIIASGGFCIHPYPHIVSCLIFKILYCHRCGIPIFNLYCLHSGAEILACGIGNLIPCHSICRFLPGKSYLLSTCFNAFY